jgi:hypothetical protein
MDFSTLQTRVSEYLEDTSNAQWSLALVKQYLNDAVRDFARRTKSYRRLSAALTASATTPTNAFYTMPTDILEVEAVHDTVNDLWLAPRGVDTLPPSWDTETGNPSWYLYGEFGWTELRVYPYPASALTGLKLYYTALPATMDGNSDTPTGIPDVYHVALVYFAVAACYRRNFEDADRAKAAEFQTLYEREVEDAIGRIGRKMNGSPVGVPYRYV